MAGGQMEEILVVGHGRSTLFEKLQSQFPDHLVQYVPPKRNLIRQKLSCNTRLAVLEFQENSQVQFHKVQNIRGKGFLEPMIFLGGECKEGLGRNSVFLAKPYEEKDLLGLSKRAVQGESIQQRLHRRVEVKEKVGIESFGVSGKIGAKMLKVSQSGALLKLIGDGRLQVGEIIRLHFYSLKHGRDYLIPARIESSPEESEIWMGEELGISWIYNSGCQRLAKRPVI
jgi:hypothetical protein